MVQNMDIKPSGAGGPPSQPITDAREKIEQTRPPMSDATAAVSDLTQTSEALKTISTQYQRSDLKDPVKLENMVSQVVNELVDSAAVRTSQSLVEDGKNVLRNWMSNDPIIRGKVMNCLEQALK
jgi:hypothetical protein